MERSSSNPERGYNHSSRRSLPDAEEAAWLDREIEKALARIHVPEPAPVTAAELERRRKVFARITHLREKVGPLSVSPAELIRELRGWPEANSK